MHVPAPVVLVAACVLLGTAGDAAKASAAPPPAARSAARDSLSRPLSRDPSVRAGVLGNGVRFFVQRNGRPEGRVALRLVVAVGSTAEAADQRGFAHFVEHMGFNGSRHFAADELIAYLRSIGMQPAADANAYTSWDKTVYALNVPTDRDTLLDRGFEVLADFAGGARMDDREIDEERGVVIEEWRLGTGAEDRMFRQQLPVVYAGSRYAERLPIGDPETIRHGSAARLRDFYRTWYVPANMTVVAVGDLDPARLEDLVRAHFGALPAQAPHPAPVYAVPPHRALRVAVASDSEATLPNATLLFKHPREAVRTLADFRRELASRLVVSMFNARLEERAHEADAPFASAGSYTAALARQTDLYAVVVNANTAGLAPGIRTTLAEISRVRQHGFRPAELERARLRLRAQSDADFAERDKHESDGLADVLVESSQTGDPATGVVADHEHTTRLLPGLTLADVNARARALMHEDSRVLCVCTPARADFPVLAEPELLALDAEVRAARIEAWPESDAAPSLMPEPPAPGAIVGRRTIEPLGVTVLTLDNGVEAWLKPTDFKADEVVFEGYAWGGHSTADSASVWPSVFAPVVVAQSGVGGLGPDDLKKALAGRLASVTPFVRAYTQGVSGSCRAADLETALQLAHLWFTHPTENPGQFENLRKWWTTYYEGRTADPDAAFADSLVAVNEDGFYLDRAPTVDVVERLELPPILDAYRSRFANAADFTFFFIGAFEPDSLAPLVARYLGSLPSLGRRTSQERPVVPRFPAAPRTCRLPRGKEPRSRTQITFFADTRADELERHRLNAVRSILQARLEQSLREDLGETYSVSVGHSTSGRAPGGETVLVSFGCAPEHVDRLVQTTLEAVRRLREEGPSTTEIAREQEIERRSLEVSEKQNRAWLAELSTFHQLGWDPLRIARRRERIERLAPTELRETCRRQFPLDRYTVVTLAPEAAATGGAGTEEAKTGTSR